MIRKEERKMYKGKNAVRDPGKPVDLSEELESRLTTFIKGQIYENAGIMLVVINAIFIGWQVEHFAQENAYLDWRLPFELTFATLFLLEFVGKAYAWGWALF